jgi:hypothetical protein
MKIFMRLVVLIGLIYGAVMAYNGFGAVYGVYTLYTDKITVITDTLDLNTK